MKLLDRQKLFENPTIEYRGKPFWSWNGKLEEEELYRQIDVMKEMGFGGYFMHSRTGLETEYLGEEWFDLTNRCADYGKKEGMESWLYDEDRWPSGSAGGMVTKEEKYRAMFLEMNVLEKEAWETWQPDENVAAVFACKVKKGNSSNIFTRKRILHVGDILEEGEKVMEFRIRYSVCNDNYNGYCYVNTMNKEAIEKYLALTHEKYRQKCGDRFGKEIRGIFTDEPHRGGVFTNFAEGEENAVPYTQDMFEEFRKRFGYSLKENLPELFLRRCGGEMSRVTRDYFELCQELFIERFAIPVYEWCRRNKLIFTGHVLHEDSLCCQAIMQGSLMRFYEYMEYPGVDVLCEGNRCYWIAKQIASVARQLDKEWVLSELYGCTGWQMNFESYKNVGDWQALFGVNLRCPHLSWYTMKGEAKRDYPASILHQSSWYPDYHYVEDYFSRIHVALHGGRPVCGLLVINPIESVWARAYSGAFNGLSATDAEIQRLERQYAALFHMLAGNQIDFDYGEEDILARHGKVEDGVLHVGSCSYRKVLVGGMDTMRSSTLALLKDFVSQGGEVIFAGEVPGYVDVIPSQEVKELSEKCKVIAFEEEAVAQAASSGLEVKIDSKNPQNIFTQMFEIEGGRMVMLLNADRERDCKNVSIDLGCGAGLELWDARSGRVEEPSCQVKEGHILLETELEKGGERLYFIAEHKRELSKVSYFCGREQVDLPDRFDYRLTERNICVLDMVSVAGYTGDGTLNEIPISRTEVLKADRRLRDILGIPYRGGEMLQPWYQVKYRGGSTKLLSTVSLIYDFEVETVPDDVQLAVENLEHIRQVLVNGAAVSLASQGKWIDICFDELRIPSHTLKTGRNTVIIIMDYYSTCGIESAYLLGNFGVRTVDEERILTVLPETLTIGDITGQGLPFYSGSVIYEIDGGGSNAGEPMDDNGKSSATQVTVNNFGGALVKLQGDSEEIIAFPPYQAEIRNLRSIEVVLTRRNTFGPLHQYPKEAPSYGPWNFMTDGNAWSSAYMLYPQGLLEKPEIIR